MKNFEGFGLNPVLSKSLEHMKYSEPTPIQAQAIPLALEGHDIMGTAQTGTGKTAAFAIPLVEKLLNDPYGSALVLTPTRELGKQIMTIMKQLLGPTSQIKTAFIIGGESMDKQFKELRNRPRLIVGTPGRINDHLERRSLMLDDTHFLVLDETDRMLDMGFSIQLERIFKYMPEDRQTLMFSATLPKNILKMSEQYMNKPKRVAVGETNVIAQNIKQEVIRIEQDKKYQELQNQLLERNGSVIVFVKTKYGADRMANNLRKDGFTSEALHGDLRQRKRDAVMNNFRKMNFRVLIATDIAARGLDVPHIEHVVNYDLPQVAEDFIHRMGRTARAGAQGSAISFVSNSEWRKWHAIECLINPDAAANDRGNDRSGYENKRGRGNKGGKGGKFGGSQNKNRRNGPKKPFENKAPKFVSRNDEQGFAKDARDYAPREERKSEFKPRGDKPRSDRPRDDKPRNDRPRSDKPRNDRPRSEKPFGDKPRGDKPFGKGKPAGKKKFDGHAKFDKPVNAQGQKDRPRKEASADGGQEPMKRKNDSQAQKPNGKRPDQNRSGKKPGGKPAGKWNAGKKHSGKKPADRKVFKGGKSKAA